MISAISSNKQNPTFTSVIPLRIFIDGMETFDPKLVRSATKQLTGTLIGPTKKDSKEYEMIKKFAQHDPDYDFFQGVKGYPKTWNKKRTQPSDFFRCITDAKGNFLFTGLQAKKLKSIGEILGKAQQIRKSKNIDSSFDLFNAKKAYAFNIKEFLNATKLRITESFNSETKQKTGLPVSLNIHLTSNKKYGQKTFKITLEDISFSKANT